jgi:hypothetical protein
MADHGLTCQRQESTAMHMFYNSENFVVVAFQVSSPDGEPTTRGGYEIVDKFSGKEIYLEGALAERFQEGVQALVEQDDAEALEEYIGGFAATAQHPVVMH